MHEIHWNADGYRYTQCLNLPIQGACADAFMLALAMIDAALFEAGIEGGPVAAPHDEIVLEVPRSRCRAGRGSPAGGDDRRLRGDLPRRAAAGPRRGEDRPVLGGDEVARRACRGSTPVCRGCCRGCVLGIRDSLTN